MAIGQSDTILISAPKSNAVAAKLRQQAHAANLAVIEAGNIYAAVALLVRQETPLRFVAISADLLEPQEMHVFKLIRSRWPDWPTYVLPSAQFPNKVKQALGADAVGILDATAVETLLAPPIPAQAAAPTPTTPPTDATSPTAEIHRFALADTTGDDPRPLIKDNILTAEEVEALTRGLDLAGESDDR